jgi:hypothetical protein
LVSTFAAKKKPAGAGQRQRFTGPGKRRVSPMELEIFSDYI